MCVIPLPWNEVVFEGLCAKQWRFTSDDSSRNTSSLLRPHIKVECSVSQVFERNITIPNNPESSWMVVAIICVLGFEGTLAIARTTGPLTVSPISQLVSVQHNHKPWGQWTLHRCSQSQHSETCAIKTLRANGDTNKVADNQSRGKLPSWLIGYYTLVTKKSR